MFLVLQPGQFFAKLKHTDRQTNNHYDRRYTHIHAVMLLNAYKNLENMHNKTNKK